MKKSGLMLLLCAALVLVPAGCGRNAQPGVTTQAPTVLQTEAPVRQPSAQVLADALAAVGITDWEGDYKKLTFVQRKQLEQYFANERGENIVFTDEGCWYVDENAVPLEGTWAQNAILNRAPEPSVFGVKVLTSRVEAKTVSVSYADVPAQKVADYIEQLKAAGFDHVTADDTTTCCGTVFQADNGKGVRVSLASKFIGVQAVTTVSVTLL